VTSWIHQLELTHFFPQLEATHEILCKHRLIVSQIAHPSNVQAVLELLAGYKELTCQSMATFILPDTFNLV